jgi:hypothetical protein
MADVWNCGMVSVVLLYFTIKDFNIVNASALGQRLHGSVGTGLFIAHYCANLHPRRHI